MPAENDNYKALERPGEPLPVLSNGPKKNINCLKCRKLVQRLTIHQLQLFLRSRQRRDLEVAAPSTRYFA
jgi:hypothetical protein